MARIIVIQDGREKSFDLIDEVTLVGSSDGCPIRLEGAEDRHCQILNVEGSFRLVDVGGVGTSVNGRSVMQHQLENGDVIKLGNGTMTFKGGIRPQTMAEVPESFAASTQPRTARAGSSQRRGRGVGGSRRKKTITKDGAGPAVAQRETLVRRRVRKPGLSGPATAAIAGGIGLVAIFLVWALLNAMAGDDAKSHYHQGVELMGKQRYDEAIAAFAAVSEDNALYRRSQEKIAEIRSMTTKAEASKDLRWGSTEFENNIIPYLEKYIATADEDYRGDTAYIRVLVKRCEAFLEKVPGHKYEPQVKSIIVKYKPQVPQGTLSWHDIEVEADAERGRRFFGPAYRMISDWLDQHRDTGDEYEVQRAERLLGRTERGAKSWWDDQDRLARQNIREDELNAAYSRYMSAVRKFRGWPEMHDRAQNLADDLQKQAPQLLTE